MFEQPDTSFKLIDIQPLNEGMPIGTVLATIVSNSPETTEAKYVVSEQVFVLFYHSGAGEEEWEIDGFAVSDDKLVTTKVFDYETSNGYEDGFTSLRVSVDALDSDGNYISYSSLYFDVLDVVETFRGTAGTDVVAGDIGADRLFGFSGRDKLFGKDGKDVLQGGLGPDMLSGGWDADVFFYKSVKESTVKAPDRITDFTHDYDMIDLSTIDANVRVSGNQSFHWLGKGKFTGHAGELRFEKRSSDTFIYADINGDKHADMTIRIDDPMIVTKVDFLL